MQNNFFTKRITIFAGHYGSGKTTLTANGALYLAGLGHTVCVCDLDIVNPYFKTAGFADLFSDNGVALICSAYANTNVDVPSLPPEANSIFDDTDKLAVIDLGGDAKGAAALGRYAARLNADGGSEMLLVVNRYRPLTRGADSLIEIRREIEDASGVPFAGIVNNSNLGGETSRADVENSLAFAEGASALLKLPVVFTAVSAEVYGGRPPAGYFPVRVYKKTAWNV